MKIFGSTLLSLVLSSSLSLAKVPVAPADSSKVMAIELSDLRSQLQRSYLHFREAGVAALVGGAAALGGGYYHFRQLQWPLFIAKDVQALYAVGAILVTVGAATYLMFQDRPQKPQLQLSSDEVKEFLSLSPNDQVAVLTHDERFATLINVLAKHQ